MIRASYRGAVLLRSAARHARSIAVVPGLETEFPGCEASLRTSPRLLLLTNSGHARVARTARRGASLSSLPQLRPAQSLPPPQTFITTLDNGVRVASEDNYDQVSSVGLFLNAGSRDETEETEGASHVLEKIAFQSTEHRTGEQFMSTVEHIGGTLHAQSQRDQIMWQMSCLRGGAHEAVSLLADTVLNATLSDDDMAAAKQVIEWEHEGAADTPEAVLMELIHEAAYGRESPLGRASHCSPHRLPHISREGVAKFRQDNVVGERLVVAGAGVEHSQLVEWAKELFGGLPRGAPVQPPSNVTYVGGEVVLANERSEYAHVSVALPCGGWTHEDAIPLCILHTMLGGGSSFSAGGPGKGMYTRLYREVLNAYGWVENIQSMAALVDSSGLMTISGACTPERVNDLARLCIVHLLAPAMVQAGEEEFERARNQLRSSVLMNLELRGILCEDIGRQVLMYGRRISPRELCDQIAKVTPARLQEVAQKYATQRPSIAVFGQAQHYKGRDHVIKTTFQNASHRW